MKRWTILLLALLMALPASVWAQAPEVKPYGAYIESARLEKDEGGERSIHLTLANAGEGTVEAVVIDVMLLDSKLRPVLEHGNTVKGFEKEIGAGTVEDPIYLDKPMAKGETAPLSRSIGKTYKKATLVRAGITYWQTTDGKAFFPTQESVIFTLSDGTRTGPEGEPAFQLPLTKEEEQLAGSFSMGVYLYPIPLSDFAARSYRQPKGGIWVMEVAPGSPGDKVGLKAGDLLHAVDGMEVAQDHFAIYRAKARMAQGETVELVWYRKGKERTASFTLPAP